MISVNLNPDGSGLVGLSGRSVSLQPGPVAASRERAIDVLADAARQQAAVLDVTVRDVDGVHTIHVHPDGTVTVDRGPRVPIIPDMTPVPVPDPILPRAQAVPDAPVLPTAAPLAVPPLPPAPAVDESRATPFVPHEPLPQDAAAPLEVDAALHALFEPASTAPSPAPVLPEAPAPFAGSSAPLEDEVEQTVIRSVTPARALTLDFTTGERERITPGIILVGRRPTPADGEPVDRVIRLEDPTRSVSKTHFALSWDGTSARFTDRASGNGSVLHRGELSQSIPAGMPVELVHGDRVQIGDQSVVVSIPATPAS